MTNRLSWIVLAVTAVAMSGTARAQTFTVQKFSIGGDGGTDYLTAEPGTGRVFVSRATHVMVIDGPTGKVIGDIPDTPRTHGIALAPRSNHGFVTNGGDSTVTMFDLKTLAVIKKIKVANGGLDVSFTLDGAPLPTTRTAIKRFLNPGQFGLQVAYYFQQGQIMSPADLSVGSHRLEVTIVDASGQQNFQDGITFFIDAPGTGACV